MMNRRSGVERPGTTAKPRFSCRSISLSFFLNSGLSLAEVLSLSLAGLRAGVVWNAVAAAV